VAQEYGLRLTVRWTKFSMKDSGIEVLHIMDWLKKEEQKKSVSKIMDSWVKLIRDQSIYSTTKVNKDFFTIINVTIKPTGK